MFYGAVQKNSDENIGPNKLVFPIDHPIRREVFLKSYKHPYTPIRHTRVLTY